MWAEQVLRVRAPRCPAPSRCSPATVLRELRMRKTPDEVDALREAGAGDRPRARADGGVARGPAAPSGRSAATSPPRSSTRATSTRRLRHRRLRPQRRQSRTTRSADRVIERRRPGRRRHRRHDCRRATAPTRPAPTSWASRPADFASLLRVLHAAQSAACDAVRPGVTAESVDAAARDVITAAGYGERFIHRTGHGIGAGGARGAVHRRRQRPSCSSRGWRSRSSPASTCPGRHGARIEDIVVCTDDGGERLNLADPRPRRAGAPDAVDRRPRPAHRRGRRAARAHPRARRDGAARRGPRSTRRAASSRARCSAPSARAGLLGLPYPEEYGGGGQPYEVYLQVRRGARQRAGSRSALGRQRAHAVLLPAGARSAPRSSASAGCRTCSAASCSAPTACPSRSPAPTRPRCGPGPCATATTTSSTATKAWITHGGVADFYNLMVPHRRRRRRAASPACSPPADTPGLCRRDRPSARWA